MSTGTTDEELRALLKRLASETSSTQALSEKDVVTLAASLTSAASKDAQSVAFLALSKWSEHLSNLYEDESARSQAVVDTIHPYLKDTFIVSTEQETNDVEPNAYVPFVALATSLYPLQPSAVTQILSSPIEDGSDTPVDPLAVLLEAAELPSDLQYALAELLAAAASTKAGRQLVRGRCDGWLRGVVQAGLKGSIGVLASSALAKLSTAPDDSGLDTTAGESDPNEILTHGRTMMEHIKQPPSGETSTLLQTLEGLSILSTRPAVKDMMAHDSAFLKALMKLSPVPEVKGGSLPVTPRGSMDITPDVSPVDLGVCYGVTTVLVNITSPRPTLSAEDEQIAKLRQMAIGKKGGQPQGDDPLEDNAAVEDRVRLIIAAGGVGALRGLARAESRRVKEALGKLCLNFVEDVKNRAVFLKEGGFKVLSAVVRDLLPQPTTSSRTKDNKPTEPNESIQPALPAFQALAKLTITTPPHLLFPPPHMTTSLNALTPFYRLLVQPSSLMAFEACMALTNLASLSPEISNRILDASLPYASGGIFSSTKEPTRILIKIEELMLDSNALVRRAATQLVCNLVASEKGFALWAGEDGNGRAKSRLGVLGALANCDDLPTRLAAGGALAVLTESKKACDILLSLGGGESRGAWERVQEMMQPDEPTDDEEGVLEIRREGQGDKADPELVHRAVVVVLNLVSYAADLDAGRRSQQLQAARRAGVEASLMDVLRTPGMGPEVLQPAVEALKLLKRYPA